MDSGEKRMIVRPYNLSDKRRVAMVLPHAHRLSRSGKGRGVDRDSGVSPG